MEYVIDQNIRVSNHSWGVSDYSHSLRAAIEAAKTVGHILVASAGNLGVNADLEPHYPATFSSLNILAVAATDNDDNLASFSSYGPVTVDLGAPGVYVYSTFPQADYTYKSGTSMAAPHVTGVVARLMSLEPALTWEQVKNRILAGVRPVDSLIGITVSAGIVSAASIGDCNGNGIVDSADIAGGTSPDCSGNGIPDECERDCNDSGLADSCDVFFGSSEDCNGNVIPDECEPDCNENGVADSCDLSAGSSPDCNENRIPDECDVAESTSTDCNSNDVPDECDIDAGTSADCDGNRLPDECQDTSQDCDGNGRWDPCDLAYGADTDCQPNGFLDQCDLDDGTSEDCGGNGVPDECDGPPRVYVKGGDLVHPAFVYGITELGYDVVYSNSFPTADELAGYDILVWGGVSLSIAERYQIEDWVSRGGGLIILQHSSSSFFYASPVTPVESAEGWILRNGTTVVDWTSPLVEELGASSSLEGYSTVPVLKPEAAVAIEWDDGVPMAVTYAYANGRIVYLNDLWVWYTGSWLGDTPYGTALMRNILRHVDQGKGVFDCNTNGVMDQCDIAMGTSPDLDGNGIPDECDACGMCSDGLYCTGVEFCDFTGLCQPGVPPCASPEYCGEDIAGCYLCVADGDCDDGAFCTGVEVCIDHLCETPDGDPCPGQFCREYDARCVDCLSDDHCDDGDLCNGIESCDVEGDCQPGPIDDCNGNQVDDACDVAAGTSDDCNANGGPDECDVIEGTSDDCNGNDVPDECEPDDDCNANQVQDICDLAGGTSADCNANGVPDECDVSEGTSGDVNTNGIPDECEVYPALAAAYPHNSARNRYISFDPNKAGNDGRDVAFRVELTSLWLGSCDGQGDLDVEGWACRTDDDCRACSGSTPGEVTACWTAPLQCGPGETCALTEARCVNDQAGSVGRTWWVGPEHPTLGNDVHLLVTEPYRKVSAAWPATVHVSDCEIVPLATYGVRTYDLDLGLGAESAELKVATIGKPNVWWADCVGPLGDYCTGNWASCSGDGDCPSGEACMEQWGPPDGITNFQEVTAAVFAFQQTPGLTVPEITWVDLHGNDGGDANVDPPNYTVNFADISQIIAAYQGWPYPYRNPADCPDVTEWQP